MPDDLLEPYGRHTAKIRLEVLERFPTAPRQADAGHRHHADDQRRRQDRHDDRADPGSGEARPPRGRRAARAVARPGVRPEGRRHRRRQGVADAARQDQPAFQRRLSRHHVRAQPARRAHRYASALRQRARHRPERSALAARHRHERSLAAPDRHRPGRPDQRPGARDRLRDHRRVRDHGHPRAGREPRRPAPAARRHRRRFHAGRATDPRRRSRRPSAR